MGDVIMELRLNAEEMTKILRKAGMIDDDTEVWHVSYGRYSGNPSIRITTKKVTG